MDLIDVSLVFFHSVKQICITWVYPAWKPSKPDKKKAETVLTWMPLSSAVVLVQDIYLKDAVVFQVVQEDL